jgi:hypothetical protein
MDFLAQPRARAALWLIAAVFALQGLLSPDGRVRDAGRHAASFASALNTTHPAAPARSSRQGTTPSEWRPVAEDNQDTGYQNPTASTPSTGTVVAYGRIIPATIPAGALRSSTARLFDPRAPPLS